MSITFTPNNLWGKLNTQETAGTAKTTIERAQLVIVSAGGGGRRYTCSELKSRGALLFPTQIYHGMAFLAMPAEIRQGRQCGFILILESCSNSMTPPCFSAVRDQRGYINSFPESFPSPTPPDKHMLNHFNKCLQLCNHT